MSLERSPLAERMARGEWRHFALVVSNDERQVTKRSVGCWSSTISVVTAVFFCQWCANP